MNPEHSEATDQSRYQRLWHTRASEHPLLRGSAREVALQALRESRLRGLPAAEEYRVISDRLYRAGVRDLPGGALVQWIEEAVAFEYEALLELRALGDRVNSAITRDDPAAAAWELICRLPQSARQRLADGMQALNTLDARDTVDQSLDH